MDKKKIFIIRLTLWLGAIVDLGAAVMMAVPRVFRAMNGIEQIPSDSATFMLLYGMPVMLGWTIILLWADRKPLERYGVFACLIPVLLCYVGVEIYGIVNGFLSFSKTLPSFAMQTVLTTLSIISYFLAKKHAEKNAE